MSYVLILKTQNLFLINFLEMLDITQNSFLKFQFSYYTFSNIQSHRYDSFFRFILLLLGDINVNPGQTTLNNNKIPLNTPPFYNCNEPTMSSECNSSDCYKEHDNSIEDFRKKRFAYFTLDHQ